MSELQANALTTAQRVADAFPLSATTARIERVINAVSQSFEAWCSRDFARAVIQTSSPEYYQGDGTRHLQLRRYPILSVERVRIMEREVTDYRRMPDLDRIGQLYRESRWTMMADSWPDLAGGVNRSSDSRTYTIDVAYTAGYVLPKDGSQQSPCTLPADLEEACIREVVRAIQRPLPTLLKEQTPGQWREEWSDPGEFDSITRSVLVRYARVAA